MNITTNATASQAPPLWTDWQQHQVADEARLKGWFEAKYKALIKYESVYEKETPIVPVNWCGKVFTPRLADLVAPAMPPLTVSGSNRATVKRQQAYVDGLVDDTNLHAIIGPTARRVSWAGRCVWKLYWSMALQRPALRIWGERDGEAAFVERDPSDPAAIQGYQFWYPVTKDKVMYYVLERQRMAGGQLAITTSAYRTRGGMPVDDPVTLESIWPANSAPPAALVTLDVPSLLGYQIDNVCGTTDYSDDLLGLQRDYILLLTQRQLVVRLLEQPMMDVPGEYTNPDGTLKEGFHLLIQQNGEAAGQIKISGWDGALTASTTQEQILLRQLYLHTPISHVLLGDPAGANASGTAKTIDLHQSEVAVDQRRAFYPDAFKWLVNASIALSRVYATADVPPIATLTVDWPAIIPPDTEAEHRMDLAERQQVVAEFEAGLRTMTDAITRLHADDPDDTTLLTELAQLAPVTAPSTT